MPVEVVQPTLTQYIIRYETSQAYLENLAQVFTKKLPKTSQAYRGPLVSTIIRNKSQIDDDDRATKQKQLAIRSYHMACKITSSTENESSAKSETLVTHFTTLTITRLEHNDEHNNSNK